MVKEEFSIYNLLRKYEEIYNKNFLAITEKQEKINFDIKFGTFCHLIGLHYCNKNKENAKDIGIRILNNKISDEKIFDMIKATHFSKGLNYVLERTSNINYFLENIDKGILVNSNNSENSRLNSTNFILQTQDKKFLELGLVNKFEDEYYLETFLIRENDKNIDYTKKNKISEIYIEDENLNFNRFSFQKEKQEILGKNPQLSYEECMDLYYRNIGTAGAGSGAGAGSSEGKVIEVEKTKTQEQDQTKGWGARASQKSGLGHGE